MKEVRSVLTFVSKNPGGSTENFNVTVFADEELDILGVKSVDSKEKDVYWVRLGHARGVPPGLEVPSKLYYANGGDSDSMDVKLFRGLLALGVRPASDGILLRANDSWSVPLKDLEPLGVA